MQSITVYLLIFYFSVYLSVCLVSLSVSLWAFDGATNDATISDAYFQVSCLYLILSACASVGRLVIADCSSREPRHLPACLCICVYM